MTYSEILERLEAATGPDREIDCMIGHAIGLKVEGMSFREVSKIYLPDWSGLARDCATRGHSVWAQGLPHYTASLDAVVALIESELPGLVRGAIGRPEDGFEAWVCAPVRDDELDDELDDGDSTFFDAHAATEPLALLTAAIRALADKEAING